MRVSHRNSFIDQSPSEEVSDFFFNLFYFIFKGAAMRNFTIFKKNEATIPLSISLFIYKTILKHQEKEIHQVLKEEHVVVCSSQF